MKVHNNKLNSPPFKVNFNNKKMKTIKEEREDGDHENNSDQSDTGYFGEETYDFNNRDDDDEDDTQQHDRDETREINDRFDLLNDEQLDDEDNQPYSDNEQEENEDINQEDEEKRIREEFGDSEEDTSPTEKMSMTMYQQQQKELEKEINQYKKRREELGQKIEKKRQEGIQIANYKVFEECYSFFAQKARVNKFINFTIEKQFRGE